MRFDTMRSLCILFMLVINSVLNNELDATPIPVAPQVFRSPEELRAYLLVLNEYYAIRGRPRFGRSEHKQNYATYEDVNDDWFNKLIKYDSDA